MNYHLHDQGKNLGVFPLEELRNRRKTGGLTGREFVWCEGMRNWKTLDSVLYPGAKKNSVTLLVTAIVAAVLVMFSVAVGLGIWAIKTLDLRQLTAYPNIEAARTSSETTAMYVARAPVVWNSKTLTAEDVRKKQREFRERQYLESYKKFGRHDSAWDADAQKFINLWIISNFGTDEEKTNAAAITDLRDKLAANPDCNDPVVLLVAGLESPQWRPMTLLLQRAIDAFQDSKYPGYPKFYASMILADKQMEDRSRRDAAAIQYLVQALKDGSIEPGDQRDIAETLVMGSGSDFRNRNEATLYQAMLGAGESCRWLGLVLQGQFEIDEAWKARGGGFAGTVSEQGWQGFNVHLAKARECLTEAWKLHPEFPLAADRMIYVSLGDSGIQEMRQWFDRAVAAQIDYAPAWKDFRWGLRPRWYGDLDSMLAFGETALKTHRYDTDVPHKFFDTVADLEDELYTPQGAHIYGREDIWPLLQEMYEGYIDGATENQSKLRATYLSVAYIARKYDVAKAQLEALDWKPNKQCLTGWYRDLSLMPVEVAARTGPLEAGITKAEAARERDDFTGALELYQELSHDARADARTAAFIKDRLKTLDIERRLQAGDWVNMLPDDQDFTGWNIVRGEFHLAPDGSLEVNAGHVGHVVYSRARVGKCFEVKGEIMQSSMGDFQGGVVFGLPETNYWGWDAFRLKFNNEGGRVAFVEGNNPSQLLHPAALNEMTNSFDFRFETNKVTASVNGQAVFKDMRAPGNPFLTTNEMHFGLGTFNLMNSTAIRYRNVQVRNLPAN